MPSLVTQIACAASADAARHFAASFAFETDCWDVHESLAQGADFVLLDVRSADCYERGHIPGAVHLPHRKIIESRLAAYPAGTVFVVYCDGPHCNGAQRGALRLAQLGRPVKLMIGGMTGWLDEGFAIERATQAPERATA